MQAYSQMKSWADISEEEKNKYRKKAAETLRNKDKSYMSKKSSSIESKLGVSKKSPRKVSVKVCRKYDLSSGLDYLYASASKYKAEWTGRTPKSCEICKSDLKTCFVDGKTRMGPWAIMCEKCHDKYGHGLGVGKGQKYEIKPEDKKSRNISKYKANPVRRSVAAEYKKLKILTGPKNVNKRKKKIKRSS
jgi:hypothetical protein